MEFQKRSAVPASRSGNQLQYSCLENPMDKGTWWATVLGVAERQTRLRPTHRTSRAKLHPTWLKARQVSADSGRAWLVVHLCIQLLSEVGAQALALCLCVRWSWLEGKPPPDVCVCY